MQQRSDGYYGFTDSFLQDQTRQTIRGLLDGEPDAVAEARKWIRHAFFPYRGRLGDDLDDLEQDALMALIEAVRSGRYKEESSLKTFARAIGHHKCLDRLRSVTRREWVDVDELLLLDKGRDPLAAMEADEARRVSLKALAETGAPCRRLWAMIEQGLDQNTMAERLDIQVGTLRARVHRCRKKALESRDRLLE